MFQKYKRLRKIGLALALISLGCWIIFGFDSAVGQIMHWLYAAPQYFSGAINLNEWIEVFTSSYGTELHFSAVVIYGLMFYWLSKHYEKNGIVKSKNIAYSIGLSLLAIGTFEFYWMLSYAYFQNQFWVITPVWPQLRIIMQNLVFCIGGSLVLLYMSCEHIEGLYKLRVNWKSSALIALTIVSAVAWWYYPLPVSRFSVTLETGEVWRNTNNFPQTLYTIDLDPTDRVNAGEWFYHGNDMVHLLNTIVKLLFALSIFYIGLIKWNSPKESLLV